MSNFANISKTVGLPQELSYANIDPVMPDNTVTNHIRVFASNSPSITATCVTRASDTSFNNGGVDQAFPSTDINFDIPCNQGSSVVLDCRNSSINYRMTVTATVAGAGTAIVKYANLRSSAYSFFDNMRITAGNGGQLESINEYALVCDSIMASQFSLAQRESSAINYGFQSNYAGNNNKGAIIPPLVSVGANAVLTQGATSSQNFNIPLVSGVLGVSASRFFPIGLVNKLLCTLTTTSICPITTITKVSVAGTAVTYSVVLSDFWLNLQTVDIGAQAMSQVMKSLHNNTIFLHGQSFRTSTGLIPSNTSGLQNIPIGTTGGSVRSIITRFHEAKATPDLTTSAFGKFSSTNPNINAYGLNIGGLQEPSYLVNPLLYPAQSYKHFQLAWGTYNSSVKNSAISETYFKRLSSGGTTSTTQDVGWQTGGSQTFQSSFFLASCIEGCQRRGLLSGRNLSNQKVQLFLGTSAPTTNPVNIYCHSIHDIVTVLELDSGNIYTII